jgi:hypothetical protein
LELDSSNWKNVIELKDRRFIVELKDRAMNRIILLYVKIKSKNIAFGIR